MTQRHDTFDHGDGGSDSEGFEIGCSDNDDEGGGWGGGQGRDDGSGTGAGNGFHRSNGERFEGAGVFPVPWLEQTND